MAAKRDRASGGGGGMINDTPELKPCPFCGGYADIQTERSGEWWYFTVCCHTEDCRGSSNDCTYFKERDAIAAWNTRPTPPADAPSIPTDMVLVPREATQAMCNAAIDTHPYELGDISPIGFRCSPQKLFAECYRAMIAAAEKGE